MAYSDLQITYVPIRYSYTKKSIRQSSFTTAYSYGSSVQGELVDPFHGFKAAQTQQILNNLPQWTKARQSQSSNAWMLTNAWGMNIENVLVTATDKITDLNLITASVDRLSRLYYTDVTSKELLEARNKKNLLFNTAFSITDVAREACPAGWAQLGNKQSISLVSGPLGTNALSTSGTLKIGQEVYLENRPVDLLSASFYYKCSSGTNIKLILAVDKLDGTSITEVLNVTTNSVEWTSTYITIPISSNLYRVGYTIICSCGSTVGISNPKLEVGSLTQWDKSDKDQLYYYPSVDNFNAVYATTIETNRKIIPLYPIADEREFIECSIPTRVQKIPRPYKNISPLSSQAFGRKVSQLGEIFRTEYAVIGSEIVERSASPSRWDIFNRYSLRDLRYTNDGRYGTMSDSFLTITPLVTCIVNNLLFIVCKEEYNGSVYRTLKIANPRTPPGGESYLECFKDFNLYLDFDTYYSDSQIENEEVQGISVSEIEPSIIVVTTNTNINYYYKLYFDYYHFKSNKNRLYTIEYYGPNNVTIL